MKKAFLFFLVLAVSVFFVSCGDFVIRIEKAQDEGQITPPATITTQPPAITTIIEKEETDINNSSSTNSNEIMFVRNNYNVQNSLNADFYVPHPASEVKCTDSFTDGNYNYYYYYLGYLENFPLMISSEILHNSPGEKTYSESVSVQSQKSIENTISNSVTVTNTENWSHKIGVEQGQEEGADALSKALKLSYEFSWGEENSTSTSNETIHSVVESWSNSTSNTVQLTLKNEDPVGYYRFVRYAKKCFVYALVVYDIKGDAFAYDFVTYTSEDAMNSGVMFEYSASGKFASDIDRTLKFDESIIGEIDLDEELPFISTSSSSRIDVPVQKHCCKADNDYDINTNGHAEDAVTDHSLYELGHISIYGCKRQGDLLSIEDADSFKIEYILDEDPMKLPNIYNNQLYLSYETETYVKDTNIRGKEIGYGAYEVKIVRKDGSTDTPSTVKCDFLKNKSKSSVIAMLEGDLRPETIKRIEITIVYELNYYHSWFDQHHTDWRSDYVFNFQ